MHGKLNLKTYNSNQLELVVIGTKKEKTCHWRKTLMIFGSNKAGQMYIEQ